jgi:hypothetical protein
VTERVHAGEIARVSDGFRAAGRLFGRMSLFWFLIGLMWTVLFTGYAALILGMALLPTLGSGDSGSAGGFVLFLCMTPLIYAYLLAGSWLISLLGELGLRRAVIGDRPAGQSVGWAFATLRRNLRPVAGFGLLMWLMQFAYQSAASLVTIVPFYAFFLFTFFRSWSDGPDPRALFSPALGVALVIMYLVMGLVAVPWFAFSGTAWTGVYHKLTDPPVEPEAADHPTASSFPPPPPVASQLPPPPPASPREVDVAREAPRV